MVLLSGSTRNTHVHQHLSTVISGFLVRMLNRHSKLWLFVVEGLTSFAATAFGYYVYFLTHSKFGFTNNANLILAAGAGLIYATFSWLGGKISQKLGYVKTMQLGLALATGALCFGGCVQGLAAVLLTLILASIGFCMVFPSIEAELSEGETSRQLQRLVGWYNITWAITGAVAYFWGGTILEKLGPRAVFFVPCVVVLTGLILATIASRTYLRANPEGLIHKPTEIPTQSYASQNETASKHIRKSFMYMAWIANPLAYAAINTLVPIAPIIAERHGLSPMWAGFYGSVWFFARVLAFILLMHWFWWHYKFWVLLGTCTALITSFLAVSLSINLPMFILGQILFGLATGLIYYSSLYYSMHVGETKGEHGGIHEAAIGLGNFAGPATGALATYFSSRISHADLFGVTLLLLLGLIFIVRIRITTAHRTMGS